MMLTKTTPQKDLFSNVRKGFDGRKMFKKAITMVQAVQKMKTTSLSTSGSSLPIFGEKLVATDESLE